MSKPIWLQDSTSNARVDKNDDENVAAEKHVEAPKPRRRRELTANLGSNSNVGLSEVPEDAVDGDAMHTASSLSDLPDIQPRLRTRARDPLEESWDSLTYFAKMHEGRLAVQKEKSSSNSSPSDSPNKTTTTTISKGNNSVMTALGSAVATAAAAASLSSSSTYEPEPSTLYSNKPSTASSSSYSSSSSLLDSEIPRRNISSASSTASRFSKSDIAFPDPFIIPELPQGRYLTIDIQSTWGDPHYVGLSGIELFDDTGSKVHLADVARQISANPADVNILPGYSGDPRTIDKLFDGINRTCDDLHVWLAPFTAGRHHYIYIDLGTPITLALIRIWNYNKSRIHSYRGARYVEIYLDDMAIFKGEIQKAPGSLKGAERCAENILFTTNESCLCAVEAQDAQDPNINPRDDNEEISFQQQSISRPKTAGKSRPPPAPSRAIAEEMKDAEEKGLMRRVGPDGRPMTGAVTSSSISSSLSSLSSSSSSSSNAPVGKRLTLHILSNWGDHYYVGCQRLEILGLNSEPLPISREMVDISFPANPGAKPPNYEQCVADLIGMMRCDDQSSNGWLVGGCIHGMVISIVWQQPVPISGIRIRNYNTSLEASYCGIKRIFIRLDNANLSPPQGHLLRKAPGSSQFDVAQLLQFKRGTHEERIGTPQIHWARGGGNTFDSVQQEYEVPHLPSGFVFKFIFTQTWGDPWYLGLNAIQIINHIGNIVPVDADMIFAVPRSVAELPDNVNDPRTPDKLFDDDVDTIDDEHMWLVPYTPGEAVMLLIVFPEPVTLSLLKIWNYAKTPERGARQFEFFLDDTLVYKGHLRKASGNSSHHQHVGPQTILFTNDKRVVSQEKHNIYVPTSKIEEPEFFEGDRGRKHSSSASSTAGNAAASSSSSSSAIAAAARPQTGMHRN